ncbi:MAG: serine/threonine protein kinase [Polyangiaceae bacterium]|nr:serine/threonine protein kinase [Polyangiaceae bacterium]
MHFGRLLGQGFARTVAIKRLHPTFARDPQFVGMFLDEARLAARIRHPNVCTILDVAIVDEVPCLVLDYVHGEPLSKLLDAIEASSKLVPYNIAAGIVCGMLHGLHAAHEATDELGHPLHIIHRDVSPQNVLVGSDGVPRVIDFGMAKAMGRLQNTADGQLKGKLGYMAPEQFELKELNQRVDIYSAAVVLWETLTAKFLFERTAPSALMHAILEGNLPHPKSIVADIPDELDAICMRGLARDPQARFATAHDMAIAIESAVGLPSPHEIGVWAGQVAGDVLRARAAVMARIEAEHPSPGSSLFPPAPPTTAHVVTPKRSRSSTRKLVGAVAIAGAAVSLLVYFAIRETPPAPVPPAQAQPPRSASVSATAVAAQPSAFAVVDPKPEEPPREIDLDPEDPPREIDLEPEKLLQSLEPEAEERPEALQLEARREDALRKQARRRREAPRAAQSAAPSEAAAQTLRAHHDCTPPYRVDADGIRHPKRECLSLNRGQ